MALNTKATVLEYVNKRMLDITGLDKQFNAYIDGTRLYIYFTVYPLRMPKDGEVANVCGIKVTTKLSTLIHCHIWTTEAETEFSGNTNWRNYESLITDFENWLIAQRDIAPAQCDANLTTSFMYAAFPAGSRSYQCKQSEFVARFPSLGILSKIVQDEYFDRISYTIGTTTISITNNG
jgi:hypothetical protein